MYHHIYLMISIFTWINTFHIRYGQYDTCMKKQRVNPESTQFNKKKKRNFKHHGANSVLYWWSMDLHKTAVSPLLMHWSYHSHALSHQYTNVTTLHSWCPGARWRHRDISCLMLPLDTALVEHIECILSVQHQFQHNSSCENNAIYQVILHFGISGKKVFKCNFFNVNVFPF